MIKPIGSNIGTTNGQLKTTANALSGQKDNSFEKALLSAKNARDNQRLKEACEDLESVFVYQMLQAMRSTIGNDPLLGNSLARNVYESMLDEEIARSVSRSGRIGLADVIYKQLSQNMSSPVPGNDKQTTDTADNE